VIQTLSIEGVLDTLKKTPEQASLRLEDGFRTPD
jgi:hypothetical protein